MSATRCVIGVAGLDGWMVWVMRASGGCIGLGENIAGEEAG